MPQRGATALDGDAVNTDVRTGKTFYNTDPSGKVTGNIPNVTMADDSQAIPAGIHPARNLVDVDADFVAAKIAKDVVMFGVTGTFDKTLSEDTVDSDKGNVNLDTGAGGYKKTRTIGAGVTIDLLTVTPTFSANSLAVGVAAVCAEGDFNIRLQCIMGGVMVAESTGLSSLHQMTICIGTRAMTGAQVCKASVKNYDSISEDIIFWGEDAGSHEGVGIAAGSAKLT